MALERAESGEIVSLAPLRGDLSGAQTTAIVKSSTFEVIRLVVHAGERIPEHKVRGAITLHCLKGAVRLEHGATALALAADDWVFLDGGVMHAVAADTDSALLLTIMLTPDA